MGLSKMGLRQCHTIAYMPFEAIVGLGHCPSPTQKTPFWAIPLFLFHLCCLGNWVFAAVPKCGYLNSLPASKSASASSSSALTSSIV